MAKTIHNDVLDASLNYIKNNCNLMTACSAEPTTYAQATSTYKLADVAMTSTDFTVGEGDTNGRKVAVAAKSNVDIDSSGTFTHTALCDTVNSKVLCVATGNSQALTAGNKIEFLTWDVEISDPV